MNIYLEILIREKEKSIKHWEKRIEFYDTAKNRCLNYIEEIKQSIKDLEEVQNEENHISNRIKGNRARRKNERGSHAIIIRGKHPH